MRLEDLDAFRELGVTRTISEFEKWFGQLLNVIPKTRDIREQIVLRKGVAKPLFEELYPMYRVIKDRPNFLPATSLQHVEGSQPYDFRLFDHQGYDAGFVEVTCADYGQNEHYRMIKFLEIGHVSMLGRVSHSGSKKTGLSITVENRAVDHAQYCLEVEAQIALAIERKLQKRYPEDTRLVVGFDDAIAFSGNEFEPDLGTLIRSRFGSSFEEFSEIYIVGYTKGRLWSSELDFGEVI